LGETAYDKHQGQRHYDYHMPIALKKSLRAHNR
jgi:hypothetical protein